jgi:hypothetical protein
MTRLRKNNSYLLSQTGNTDETPLYFDMPTNMIIKGKGEKSITICTTGLGKQHCIVMFAITASGSAICDI